MKRRLINIIENICIWILKKLNIQRLKKLTIDNKRIVIGISKFLPDDNKWHVVNVNVNASIKVSKKRKISRFDDIAIFIDGKRRMKRRIR